jgi:hypothetical protein
MPETNEESMFVRRCGQLTDETIESCFGSERWERSKLLHIQYLAVTVQLNIPRVQLSHAVKLHTKCMHYSSRGEASARPCRVSKLWQQPTGSNSLMNSNSQSFGRRGWLLHVLRINGSAYLSKHTHADAQNVLLVKSNWIRNRRFPQTLNSYFDDHLNLYGGAKIINMDWLFIFFFADRLTRFDALKTYRPKLVPCMFKLVKSTINGVILAPVVIIIIAVRVSGS